MAAPACGSCALPLEANQPTVKALGRDFHRECLICTRCRAPPDGNYYEKDGKVYCRKDYFAMFGTQCNRCSQNINGKLMAFNNKFYHPDCFYCVACKKKIIAGEKCGLRGNDLFCETDWDPARAAQNASQTGPAPHVTGVHVPTAGPMVGGYTPGKSAQQLLLEQQQRMRASIPTIAEPHDDSDRKRVRTKISEEQIAALERAFEQTPMPDGQMREHLANSLNLNLRVIQVWFQNRRAKEKKVRGGSGHGYDSVPNSPLPTSGQSTPRLSGGSSVGGGSAGFVRRDLFAPRPNMPTMGGYASSTNTTPAVSPLVSPALSPSHHPYGMGDMPIHNFESMTLDQSQMSALNAMNAVSPQQQQQQPQRSPSLRPQPQLSALPPHARVHALESMAMRRSQSEPSLAELALGGPSINNIDLRSVLASGGDGVDRMMFDPLDGTDSAAADVHMSSLLMRGHPPQRPSVSDTQAVLEDVASAVRGGIGSDFVLDGPLTDPAADLDEWLSDILMSTERAVVDARVHEESQLLRSLGEGDFAADPFMSVMGPDDDDIPRTVPGSLARAAIDPPLLSAIPDRVLGDGSPGGLRRVKSAPLFPNKRNARNSAPVALIEKDRERERAGSPLKAQHASMKRRSAPYGLKRNESLEGRLSSSRSSLVSAIRRSRSQECLVDSNGASDFSGQDSDDSMRLDIDVTSADVELNVTL